MKTYQMTQHTGGDMGARFYIDGVRVSDHDYSVMVNRAYREGRVDCFSTSGKQLPGGKIRRVNHFIAHVPE